MAWRDRLTVYARCPKHPRFNPDKGIGAVKAGCETCWSLFTLYRAFENVKRAIKEFSDRTAARREP